MTIKTQHNYLKIYMDLRATSLHDGNPRSSPTFILTTGLLSLRNPNYFSHSMAPVTFGVFFYYYYYVTHVL